MLVDAGTRGRSPAAPARVSRDGVIARRHELSRPGITRVASGRSLATPTAQSQRASARPGDAHVG